MKNTNDDKSFDLTLAVQCATAFSGATGLGCVVSKAGGGILHESGYGCGSCKLCEIANLQKDSCVQSQIYGMVEAERFGGKYIYFCPMGLTCFVSPIVGGSEGSTAKITVGPFLMVEPEDYISCDLKDMHQLTLQQLDAAGRELINVPIVKTEKVNQLSILLFMAVGFMNNVSAANKMLATQGSDAIQGQISSYIMQLKQETAAPPYPFETERALLHAIKAGDKPEAQRLLNELFGHIFFTDSGDFKQAKSRIYELLVLISRASLDAGADPESTLRLSHDYLHAMQNISDVDALCFWLVGVMNKFMDAVFNFMDMKHADVIHKSIAYLRAHYAEKITLEAMAGMVFLSPAYFSRIFKRETSSTFNQYLNNVRIEKSCEMLLHQNLRLTDIALLAGFEDQSYFTKVFKKVMGIPPLKYRDFKGNIPKAYEKPSN